MYMRKNLSRSRWQLKMDFPALLMSGVPARETNGNALDGAKRQRGHAHLMQTVTTMTVAWYHAEAVARCHAGAVAGCHLRRWQGVTLRRWQAVTLRQWQAVTLRRWQAVTLRRWQGVTLKRWQGVTLRRWQAVTLRSATTMSRRVERIHTALKRKESTTSRNKTDNTDSPSGKNPHGTEEERIHNSATQNGR